MLDTLLQMFALIGLGLVWSALNPTRLDGELVRRVITDAVYYLFLPALVLAVLWRAPLGIDTLKISLSATAGVGVGLLMGWLACRACHTSRAVTGAILLAAGFPNATYMGLPVLERTFGPWARSIAIQYDLFACTPLLLTLGIMLANAYGSSVKRENALVALLKVPPLWAAALAIALNLNHIVVPPWADGLLSMMGAAVVPLMLMAVGMALSKGLAEWRRWPTVIPVIVIQLLIMPLAVWGTAKASGLTGEVMKGVVLEGAMPSMALGVVLCDRYGLNTGVYAAAMTITTVLSVLTLPFWFHAV